MLLLLKNINTKSKIYQIYHDIVHYSQTHTSDLRYGTHCISWIRTLGFLLFQSLDMTTYSVNIPARSLHPCHKQLIGMTPFSNTVKGTRQHTLVSGFTNLLWSKRNDTTDAGEVIKNPYDSC